MRTSTRFVLSVALGMLGVARLVHASHTSPNLCETGYVQLNYPGLTGVLGYPNAGGTALAPDQDALASGGQDGFFYMAGFGESGVPNAPAYSCILSKHSAPTFGTLWQTIVPAYPGEVAYPEVCLDVMQVPDWGVCVPVSRDNGTPGGAGVRLACHGEDDPVGAFTLRDLSLPVQAQDPNRSGFAYDALATSDGCVAVAGAINNPDEGGLISDAMLWVACADAAPFFGGDQFDFDELTGLPSFNADVFLQLGRTADGTILASGASVGPSGTLQAIVVSYNLFGGWTSVVRTGASAFGFSGSHMTPTAFLVNPDGSSVQAGVSSSPASWFVRALNGDLEETWVSFFYAPSPGTVGQPADIEVDLTSGTVVVVGTAYNDPDDPPSGVRLMFDGATGAQVGAPLYYDGPIDGPAGEGVRDTALLGSATVMAGYTTLPTFTLANPEQELQAVALTSAGVLAGSVTRRMTEDDRWASCRRLEKVSDTAAICVTGATDETEGALAGLQRLEMRPFCPSAPLVEFVDAIQNGLAPFMHEIDWIPGPCPWSCAGMPFGADHDFPRPIELRRKIMITPDTAPLTLTVLADDSQTPFNTVSFGVTLGNPSTGDILHVLLDTRGTNLEGALVFRDVPVGVLVIAVDVDIDGDMVADLTGEVQLEVSGKGVPSAAEIALAVRPPEKTIAPELFPLE